MHVTETTFVCPKAVTRRRNKTFIRARWPFAALLCILALLCPLGLHAQTNYVYVNNQSGVANSIVGFSVDHAGVLTPVPGSPFTPVASGQPWPALASTELRSDPAKNLLFVSNWGDQTISVMQITPMTGILTAAPGSPFASGLTLDSCAGISLAATPNGNFLMASSNGQIKTFSVAANGALSRVSTATSYRRRWLA